MFNETSFRDYNPLNVWAKDSDCIVRVTVDDGKEKEGRWGRKHKSSDRTKVLFNSVRNWHQNMHNQAKVAIAHFLKGQQKKGTALCCSVRRPLHK